MIGLGRHILIELYECEHSSLNDVPFVEQALRAAALAAGATVLGCHFYRFQPHGVSGVVVIAESHLSIHSWPELGYAAVDLFTCGPNMHPERATAALSQSFSAGRMELRELVRGEKISHGTHRKRRDDQDMKEESTQTSLRFAAGLDLEAGWFHEGTVPGRRHGNVNHGFRITKLVYFGKTAFQEVLIIDNPVYGRVLALDGIVQLSTFDEHRYHEMLVHPAMLAHPAPAHVLIVGGGDGGTLRETLVHAPADVVMIDIDREFVELAARHLPTLSAGAFEDPRVTLLHEDAAVAIERYRDRFDVILIDCNDAMGPSVPLFESPFYGAVARALRPGGVVAVQVGAFLDVDFLEATRAKLAAVLPRSAAFRFTMPSYHCGEYCFLVASQEVDPRGPAVEELARRLHERGITSCKYYSPDMHHASQVLPPSLVLR